LGQTENLRGYYRNRFSGYEGGRYSSGSTTWRHDNSRGNGFVGGGYNTGQGNRGQFEGRGNRDRQQSFNNNYRQQDTRSNQQIGPQRQWNNAVPQQSNNAALQQFGNTGSRRFNNNEGSQQFSRPQVQQQQQLLPETRIFHANLPVTKKKKRAARLPSFRTENAALFSYLTRRLKFPAWKTPTSACPL